MAGRTYQQYLVERDYTNPLSLSLIPLSFSHTQRSSCDSEKWRRRKRGTRLSSPVTCPVMKVHIWNCFSERHSLRPQTTMLPRFQNNFFAIGIRPTIDIWHITPIDSSKQVVDNTKSAKINYDHFMRYPWVSDQKHQCRLENEYSLWEMYLTDWFVSDVILSTVSGPDLHVDYNYHKINSCLQEILCACTL